ncbi:MAG: ABC transporter permease subunit [Pseudomonadales bacterium]|nr:ABC transporter permease subunit [Pseudomonadales bacterium]
MTQFLVRRIFFAAITFFAIVTVVFFLVRLAPGGPFDGERRLPPEIETNLRAAYNLDAPLYEQYRRFVVQLLQGDLGPSFKQKDFSINELIAAGLPVSMGLGISALFVALLLGLLIGTTAGFNQGTAIDRVLMGLSNFNLAIPTIVSAPLMVLIFSVALSLFPAGGADTWWHFVLPTFALAIPFSAELARLIRGGVAETISEPHVRTAYAKGIGTVRTVNRHILPIAVLPMISYLAPAAAGLLTGTVVIEQVFNLPGIGRYFVDGALNRDYTLVMGVTIVYSLAILIFNLIADVAYGLVDPRIRVTQK